MLPLSCTPLLLYEFHQLLHGQLESPQGVVSGGCHLWVGELVGYLWVSHLGGGRVGGLPMGGLPRLGRVVADWWLGTRVSEWSREYISSINFYWRDSESHLVIV